MVQERRGNIFLTDAEVITVTVNCEGVMGAGIALEARLRWPALFDAYVQACESGELRIGRLWAWTGPGFPEPGQQPNLQRVLCFPTKDRWRAPSKLEYIERGLADLVERRHELSLASVALPRLGASHGRLDWAHVAPVIDRHLAAVSDLTVEVWEHDTSARDPWLAWLRTDLGPQPFDPTRIKERLGVSRLTQAKSVVDALRSPMARTMADLPGFLGETTLEAIYEYVRNPRPDQGTMF